MAFSDWLLKNVLKKELEFATIQIGKNMLENEQSEKEFQKREVESSRREYIERTRKKTPCKFNDGISYKEFSEIAYRAGNRINRIKDVTINEAIIYCTVESQTGYSEWDFCVDFNNWGHITGTYWKRTENYDSSIPKHFADIVSGDICQLLREKNIHLLDFSDYVDDNKELGQEAGLSYYKKIGFFKKTFSGDRWITCPVDSQSLLGEHVYPVVSILKSNGFKNIKSIPIKDIGENSDKYTYEVEQVVINGTSFFEDNDSFLESAQVIITYHKKQEILIPYAMNFFRKKDYIVVGDQLQNMGFSNIYERKIKDLVTGWITKDGAVEEVLVKVDGKEVPIDKNHPYEFDAEIFITYHTYK